MVLKLLTTLHSSFCPLTALLIMPYLYFSAGQQLAKQAIQEIVILPSLRPEVCKRISQII